MDDSLSNSFLSKQMKFRRGRKFCTTLFCSKSPIRTQELDRPELLKHRDKQCFIYVIQRNIPSDALVIEDKMRLFSILTKPKKKTI